MLERLERSLTSLDYFGLQIQFTLNKKKKFKTMIGGIVSFLIYCLILSLIITNGLILLDRKQPKTSATSLFEIDQPLINITKTGSFFAAYFLTRDFQAFFDPSFFSFEVFQFVVQREENGNSNVSYIPLEMKNCSMYNQQFKQKGFEKDFLQNSLQEAVCFDPKEREMIIGGRFSGNYFSNILFRFSRCRNFTDSSKIKRNKYELSDQEQEEQANILNKNDNNINWNSEFINNKNFRSLSYHKFVNKYNKDNNDNYSHNNSKLNKNITKNVENFYSQDSKRKDNKFGENTEETVNNKSRKLNVGKTYEDKETWTSRYSLTEEERKSTICKSESEISDKIRSGYFQFYYMDENINLNEHENPFSDYFTRYFILLDSRSRKFVDLYYKSVNITSDAGLIFQEPITSSSIIFDYYREQSETFTDSDQIIDLYVNSSNNVLRYNVIFLKFQDFAAGIGGLMNVLLQMGGFIALFFNNYRMNESLINDLFLMDENLNHHSDKMSKNQWKSKEDFNPIKNPSSFDYLKNNRKIHKNYDQPDDRTISDFNVKNKNEEFNSENISSNKMLKQGKNDLIFYLEKKKSINISDFNKECNEKKLIEPENLRINNDPTIQQQHHIQDNKLEKDKQLEDYGCFDTNQDLKILETNKNLKNQKINNFLDTKDKLKPNNQGDLYKNGKLNIELNNSFENKKNFINNETQKSDCKNQINNNLNNDLNLQAARIQSKKLLNSKIKTMIDESQRKNQLKLNWYQIICLTFCPLSKNLKIKQKIYSEGKKELYKYLDFLDLVNNLQELDKLKEILFTRDHLDLINLIKKPRISIDINKINQKELKSKEENKIDYYDLFIKYKKLKEDYNNCSNSNKIIEEIHPEIKNAFDDILKNSK